MSNILTVDVGGTKTLIASFNNKGEVVEQFKFPTPVDYKEFITQLVESIQNLQSKKFEKCVIAMPGKMDRKKGVVLAFGNLGWHDVPIVSDLEHKLSIPVKIENDAKLAALSEAHLIPEYRKVLYITVSTGIGGGMIINGKIDPNNKDAEYGHMLLEHDGKLQRWEAFASGKAIVEKFGKRASEIEDQATWYIVARNIALGLIDVIAATTPDAIVIGGGVGSHFAKYGDKLIEELKLYEDDLLHVPPVFGAQNAEEAVIYGCYILANQ
ncbi:MAG: ROK family protein [bacterium]